jgi:hypothetical protein
MQSLPNMQKPSAAYVARMKKTWQAQQPPSADKLEWITQKMYHELVPNDRIIEKMRFARPGDVPGLPRSLEGIFWIDQFLESSIGQTPAFRGADPRWPFQWRTPSTETLGAFGDWPVEWVSPWKQRKLSGGRSNLMGTATMVPNGGGALGHWTFGTYPDSGFCYLFGLAKCCMKCVCLPDTLVSYISVRVTWDIRLRADFRFNKRKEIEDPVLNPEGVEMILDLFSGEEYVNTVRPSSLAPSPPPLPLLSASSCVVYERLRRHPLLPAQAPFFELRMQKRPWGWVRTTHIIEGAWEKMDEKQRAFLKKILPAPFFYGVKNGGIWGASQYPVIQVVDGLGRKTKYYNEYLEWANRQNPGGQYMGTFQPDSTGGACLEPCVGKIITPCMDCAFAFCNDEPPCACCPCCQCRFCCCCLAAYADKYRSPLPFAEVYPPAAAAMDRH